MSMRINISNAEGELLWQRDTTMTTPSGMACAGYLRDGTQAKIINALSDALAQATAEASALPVADVVSDVCSTTA